MLRETENPVSIGEQTGPPSGAGRIHKSIRRRRTVHPLQNCGEELQQPCYSAPLDPHSPLLTAHNCMELNLFMCTIIIIRSSKSPAKRVASLCPVGCALGSAESVQWQAFTTLPRSARGRAHTYTEHYYQELWATLYTLFKTASIQRCKTLQRREWKNPLMNATFAWILRNDCEQ